MRSPILFAFTQTLAPLDIGIIVGFLVLMIVIGTVLTRVASGGLEDYFLGGNRIPWWLLGVSTAASNFDMSGTMIVVAVLFGLGYRGFMVELRGGVGLSLAFSMAFLGKWLRRSQVMTSAEWMKLRFGTDRPGQVAHILSAVANLVLCLGLIIYFAKGSGKFLTAFLPLPEVACTSIMVAIGLFYTLLSGLYGVVFTDAIQMALLIFTSLFVSVYAFRIRSEVELPSGLLDITLENPQGSFGDVLLAADPQGWGMVFQLFAVCVFVWLARTMIEGAGGITGYTDQRFFAAKTERDASLVGMESILISILRWTLMAGLVVMGYSLLAQGGPEAEIIRQDAEQVLPTVLAYVLPVGVRGLVIAGLIAAAMSTFDSTLNAGASFLVRDLYETYLDPEASQERLVWVSRLATVALCAVGIGVAAFVPNINQIWSLLTMGLGAGLSIPLLLRWYWPRFNGYGFAAGTAAGVMAALIFNAALNWPVYLSFPAIIGCGFVGSVLVSFLTPPTEEKVLIQFCNQVDPWGPWGRWRQQSDRDPEVSRREHGRDVLNLVLVIGFQITSLLGAMALIWQDWSNLAWMATISISCGIGLYFTWYLRLPAPGVEEISSPEESLSSSQGRRPT